MNNEFRYLRWNSEAVGGFDDENWEHLLTEIDKSGVVTREVALDHSGKVVRLFPDPNDPDYRGLFDLVKIDVENLECDVAQDAFLKYFQKLR